jgi:hypothetical protein
VSEVTRILDALQQDDAALLRVNEKTVRRHWEAAKLRLFQNIKAGQ